MSSMFPISSINPRANQIDRQRTSHLSAAAVGDLAPRAWQSCYQEPTLDSNLKLMQFLEQTLKVLPAEIEMLLRHPEQAHAPFPMLLWQYGLVTLQQLTQIFDWLEHQL
jgi:hypothetical protein